MFVIAAVLVMLAIPFAWAATRAEKHVSLLSMLRLKFLLVPMLRVGTRFFPLVPMLRVGTRFFQRSASMDAATADAEQCKLSVPTQSMGTRKTSPSLLSILRRHNPGLVLAVGVAMGIGLGLPSTFLRPFAAELGIPRIGLFFMVYAITAIITRVLTRRWVERFGPRPIILLGLAGLTASIMLFLLVGTEWQLVLPAFGFGCSHAVLFPSVVAAGSRSFPAGNRGMATLLMLATWDVGRLIGAPTAGATLRIARLTGLPPYPTMFITAAGLLALIWLWYATGVFWAKRKSRNVAQSPSAVLEHTAVLAVSHGQGRLCHTSPPPEPEESVDFSGNSRSNILIEASGPAMVGQNDPAPSPAGGGVD